MLVPLLACSDPAPRGSIPIRLVPRPALVEAGDGVLLLDGARVGGDEAGRIFAEDLGLAWSDGDSEITLSLDPTLSAEGYTLDVEDVVTLRGGDAAGLGWGIATLRQLLPPATLGGEGALTLPRVHIEDAPRFAWRGLMIDVARHFFTVEEIERQIDLAALHKLNRVHLHLTDDQGWRLEIRSWPELVTVGGATEVGGGPGGWYTQEEFAGLVAYAAARQVTLVPEIDFPGHANAALASYAELNEDGVAEEIYTGEAVITTPLWLDGEATAGFVEDVLGEVAALTPGEVVHVGGDEAVDVSADDYAAFVLFMQDVLAAEGKTLAGWDEIGSVDLEAPFIAQHWYDEDNARAAVGRGGELLASPAEHAYLDMAHDGDAEFGQVWAGLVDVSDAYDWEPVPDGLAEDDVIGVEGALWTEFIDDETKMDLMVWPRLCALAEVGWSAERDWDDFAERLAWHGRRLDAAGVGYYRSSEIAWEVE